MLRKRFLAIALLAALFGASSASAYDTLVGGDLTIDVEVGEVETEAATMGNAETDIGTINDGSAVFGRAQITVVADDVETEASYLGNACTSIASVGGCKNQGGGF